METTPLVQYVFLTHSSLFIQHLLDQHLLLNMQERMLKKVFLRYYKDRNNEPLNNGHISVRNSKSRFRLNKG